MKNLNSSELLEIHGGEPTSPIIIAGGETIYDPAVIAAEMAQIPAPGPADPLHDGAVEGTVNHAS